MGQINDLKNGIRGKFCGKWKFIFWDSTCNTSDTFPPFKQFLPNIFAQYNPKTTHFYFCVVFPPSWETSCPTIFPFQSDFLSNLIAFYILRNLTRRYFAYGKKKKSAITQTLTQPDASDRLFTRAEVAEYLNIGATFIEQLRRQGKLPSYRLSGKCIRYKKSDCDVLLDHCFVARPAKSAKEGEI